MGKNAWIIFGIICIVIVAAVLVLMLVLVPQVKSTGAQVGEYQQIAKQEYTFSGNDVGKLKHEYGITTSDVNKGKKNDKYDEGNINPFTPPKEVTIYNEPTLKDNNKTNSGILTPDDK